MVQIVLQENPKNKKPPVDHKYVRIRKDFLNFRGDIMKTWVRRKQWKIERNGGRFVLWMAILKAFWLQSLLIFQIT